VSVDRAEVARIAELARLSLDEDEIERLTGDMNRILGFADRLRGDGVVGEGGLEKSSTGTGPVGGARDAAGPATAGVRSAEAEIPDALASGAEAFAPRFEQGFFVVPPPPGVTADAADSGEGA